MGKKRQHNCFGEEMYRHFSGEGGKKGEWSLHTTPKASIQTAPSSKVGAEKALRAQETVQSLTQRSWCTLYQPGILSGQSCSFLFVTSTLKFKEPPVCSILQYDAQS